MPDHKLSVKPIWDCDDPPDDRCARHTEPPFLPGIAVRHSPSCDDNYCGLFQCDGGNWRVTNQGTLDRAKWIEGWIITQLFTRGYVDCDEHPLGKRTGGWWADAFRVSSGRSQFVSGSKLYALQWTRATNELLIRVEDYARAALEYLQRWGIVSSLNLKAVYVARGNAPIPGAVIQLHISITGPGVRHAFTIEGRQMPNSDWLLEEYKPPRAITTGGRHYQGVTI